MRTSTRLVTAFIGFMLMPLVILFALPTMENPDEMAVVALAGVALYLFMFVTFRRTGPKAQHSARLLARMTLPSGHLQDAGLAPVIYLSLSRGS